MDPARVFMLAFLVVVMASGVLVLLVDVHRRVHHLVRHARRRRAWRARPISRRYASQPRREAPHL